MELLYLVGLLLGLFPPRSCSCSCLGCTPLCPHVCPHVSRVGLSFVYITVHCVYMYTE